MQQINLPGLVSIYHRMRFVDGKQEYSGCTVLLVDHNIAATAENVPKALAKAQDRLSKQRRKPC